MSRITVERVICDDCGNDMDTCSSHWVELPSTIGFPNTQGGNKTHYCPDCQHEHVEALVEALGGRMING